MTSIARSSGIHPPGTAESEHEFSVSWQPPKKGDAEKLETRKFVHSASMCLSLWGFPHGYDYVRYIRMPFPPSPMTNEAHENLEDSMPKPTQYHQNTITWTYITARRPQVFLKSATSVAQEYSPYSPGGPMVPMLRTVPADAAEHSFGPLDTLPTTSPPVHLVTIKSSSKQTCCGWLRTPKTTQRWLIYVETHERLC